MPSPVWKGSIVLSLVSIPVKLFAANENLQKFPDEAYGDMELPFSRRKADADSDR